MLTFRAAVLRRTGVPLSIETVTCDPPKADEVLVRVRATALCHTDLEVIDGTLAAPLPIVLGHETSGIVEQVGDQVTGLARGTPVVLSWNPTCGQCFYCRRGQRILCERYRATGPKGLLFDGTTRLSVDGAPLHHMMFIAGLAEYCVVPAQCAIPVHSGAAFDCCCLIGCGVMTGHGAVTTVAEARAGESVLVIGCGAVGLSAVQAARVRGAAPIIAVDLSTERRALARSFGATHALDAASGDVIAQIMALTEGRGADVVIEAAGAEPAFRLSAESVRPGGKVIWLGKVGFDRKVGFRWGSLMGEKHFLRSSYGGARPEIDFPALIKAYLAGELNLDAMVTERIRLEDVNAAFSRLRRGETLRSVVTFGA